MRHIPISATEVSCYIYQPLRGPGTSRRFKFRFYATTIRDIYFPLNGEMRIKDQA
jgi:hypothetical protein